MKYYQFLLVRVLRLGLAAAVVVFAVENPCRQRIHARGALDGATGEARSYEFPWLFSPSALAELWSNGLDKKGGIHLQNHESDTSIL